MIQSVFSQFKTCLKYNFKFFIRRKFEQKQSDIIFEVLIIILMNAVTGIWLALTLLKDCSSFLFFQKIIFMHLMALIWFVEFSFSTHLFVVDNQQNKRFFAVVPISWVARGLSYFCLSILASLLAGVILSATVAVFFIIHFGITVGIKTFFSLLLTNVLANFISGLLFITFKFILSEKVFSILVVISESIGFFAVKLLLTFGVQNPQAFNEAFAFVPGVNHVWILYGAMEHSPPLSQIFFVSSFLIVVFLYIFSLNIYLIQKPKTTRTYNKSKTQIFANANTNNKLITKLYQRLNHGDSVFQKFLCLQISKVFNILVVVLLVSLKISSSANIDINQYALIFISLSAGLSELIIPGFYSQNPEANYLLKIFFDKDNYYALKKIYYESKLKTIFCVLIALLLTTIFLLFDFNVKIIFTAAVILISFFVFYFAMIQIFSERIPFAKSENNILTDANTVSMKAWIFVPIIYVMYKKCVGDNKRMIVFTIMLLLFAIYQYRRAYFKIKSSEVQSKVSRKQNQLESIK